MSLHTPSSLQQLHDLFLDGAALTQAEAAERLDLSVRQVRRLVRQLRDEDVPVQERQRGREKEYFLEEEDRRPHDFPIDLSEQQILALVVAAEAARSALRPTPLSEPLNAALDALLDRIAPHNLFTFNPEEAPAHWHFGDAPSVDLDPEVFGILAQAVDRKRSVLIDYHTASTGRFSTDRKIDPLVMAVPGGSWLCAAYCHEREQVLDFNLVGIKAIRWCDPEGKDDDFDPPTGFDPELHFKGRFSAVSGDESYFVRLLVEPDRAPYFRRKKYHPTQQIMDERADGRLVVSYDVDGLEEIGAWVRSWGAGVKVLAPPELAAQIAADAATTQARYAE